MTDTLDLPLRQNNRLPIGRVVSETFQIFARAPLHFILLRLIVAVPSVVYYLFLIDRGAMAVKMNPKLGVVSALAFLLEVFAFGATIHAAHAMVTEGAFVFKTAFGVGLRRFFPLLLTMILIYLALVLGLVLLVVPGLVMIVALTSALPVCVVEKRGPLASFGRSFVLTRKNRWRILASTLIVFIPLYAVLFAIQFLSIRALGFVGGSVVSLICGMLVGPIGSIYMVVVYEALLRLVGGVTTGTIAATFE